MNFSRYNLASMLAPYALMTELRSCPRWTPSTKWTFSTAKKCFIRSSFNTVDLSRRGRMPTQPGDPLVEAVHLQAMRLAIRLACESADRPVVDMLVPEGA